MRLTASASISPQGELGLRNHPQQARSRARLAGLLAAADQILAAEGPLAVTTTRVATVAGVSIGSVYHYLPDREAILHALAVQYLAGFEAQMQTFLTLSQKTIWDDLVGTLIETYAAAYRSQPGFRALWFGGALSDETLSLDQTHKRNMGEGLRAVLVTQGMADSERLGHMCRAGVLAADALIQEAFRDNPEGDPALLSEVTTMLRGYLMSYV